MAKPPWWRMVLLPPWLSYALVFFALTMFVGYPVVIATTPMKSTDRSGALGAYVIVVVIAVVYGIWSGLRTRRTIIESNEYGYTIRFERLRRKTASDRAPAAQSGDRD
jgi:hypothetical protein